MSNFCTNVKKSEAIKIPKGESRRKTVHLIDGKKVFVHHETDKYYKWQCDSIQEVKEELEKMINIHSHINRKGF